MIHPLVGHEEVRRALARAGREDSLPAALLLMGPRGIGKQRFALWLAQAVLCEAPGGDGGCGDCRNCRRVLKLEHPDLHWFFPLPRPKGISGERLGAALEEARHGRLAELRESPLQSSFHEEPTGIFLAAAQEIRRKAQSRPAERGDQVFIIAEAETLVPQESSPEAANALLKLLEEPPANTRFLLTSSEPGRLLDTIRSRTVPLHLAPISVPETERFLVEHGAPADEATRAAQLSGGSIGMALGFLPTPSGEPGPLEALRQRSFALLRAGLSGSSADGYALALEFGVTGARALVPLLDFLDVWLRDLAAAATGEDGRVVNKDAAPFLSRVARERGLHPAAVSESFAAVEEARQEARGNVNPQLLVAGLVGRLRGALLSSPLSPVP